VRAAIEWAFGQAARPEQLIDIPKAGQASAATHRAPRRAGNIYLALPVIDPSQRATKLAVTNMLLGGFFSSRITRNLRGTRLHLPPSSSIGSTAAAHWTQTADVTTAVAGPALGSSEIDRARRAADGGGSRAWRHHGHLRAGQRSQRTARPARSRLHGLGHLPQRIRS
jgi:hypothetical protein